MPCFSTGPTRGTPDYEAWLPDMQGKFDPFAHVVDYYYQMAGFPMPQPASVEHMREWCRAGDLPQDVTIPVDPDVNKCVLRQILLHLDCDGIDVFQLNDIGNFLLMECTPQRLGYAFVVIHCFAALRNHAL